MLSPKTCKRVSDISFHYTHVFCELNTANVDRVKYAVVLSGIHV